MFLQEILVSLKTHVFFALSESSSILQLGLMILKVEDKLADGWCITIGWNSLWRDILFSYKCVFIRYLFNYSSIVCIMNLITFTESCKYICFRVVQRAVLEVMKPCNDWKTHLADVMKRPNLKVQLCCAHRQFHFTVDYILNTSYLTDAYISFTLKLESR